jgi:hypothetical protein
MASSTLEQAMRQHRGSAAPRALVRNAALVAFLTAALAPARAQEPKGPPPNDNGGFTGFVLDAEGGAPLEGARVVLESAALGAPLDVVTDAKGAFELTLLPAGTYKVSVCRAGYDDFSQGDIPLRPNRTLKVKVPLQRSAQATAKAGCGPLAK